MKDTKTLENISASLYFFLSQIFDLIAPFNIVDESVIIFYFDKKCLSKIFIKKIALEFDWDINLTQFDKLDQIITGELGIFEYWFEPNGVSINLGNFFDFSKFEIEDLIHLRNNFADPETDDFTPFLILLKKILSFNCDNISLSKCELLFDFTDDYLLDGLNLYFDKNKISYNFLKEFRKAFYSDVLEIIMNFDHISLILGEDKGAVYFGSPSEDD